MSERLNTHPGQHVHQVINGESLIIPALLDVNDAVSLDTKHFSCFTIRQLMLLNVLPDIITQLLL